MKNILYTIILSFLFSSSVSALEVTNYSSQRQGFRHSVTVALDNLDDRALVRCVIKMNNKPVGMSDEYINGVGTIIILIASRPTETSASCYVLETEEERKLKEKARLEELEYDHS